MKEAVQEFFRPMLASLCKVGLVFVDLWPINILIVSIAHSWNQGDGMLILALIFMVGVDIVTKACSIVCRKIAGLAYGNLHDSGSQKTQAYLA